MQAPSRFVGGVRCRVCALRRGHSRFSLVDALHVLVLVRSFVIATIYIRLLPSFLAVRFTHVSPSLPPFVFFLIVFSSHPPPRCRVDSVPCSAFVHDYVPVLTVDAPVK